MNRADFLIGHQNSDIIVGRFHLLWIRHHVWREVSFVKLHSLRLFELNAKRLTLFNSDHTVFSYRLHRACDRLSDLGVIGRNGRDLFNRLGHTRDRLGLRLNLLNECRKAFFHSTSKSLRINTSRHQLQPFIHHRLREDGRGRRSVTGNISGFGSNFFHELGTHIL